MNKQTTIFCLILTALATQSMAQTVASKCNVGCTACTYNAGGNFCQYCAGSQLVGGTCTGGPATPNCIYHKGTTICEYCEAGYTHISNDTCVRALGNTNNNLMRNCAFSYTDGSGIDGCNGCLPGYVMDSFYSCSTSNNGSDPNCLTHGFRRNDNFKTLKCIQCYNGYFIDSTGRCSALPTNLLGCAVPNSNLSGCLWCDGYNGYYESNADQFGNKLCSPGSVNYYAKSKNSNYYNGVAVYQYGIVFTLLVSLYSMF